MRTTERNCSGCRYWSEMVAMVRNDDVVAMCLGGGAWAGKYTKAQQSCDSYAKNSHGAVDDPPDYGEESRAAYEKEAQMKHANGAPMFASDGTMLDEKGNRSIFDDVDE